MDVYGSLVAETNFSMEMYGYAPFEDEPNKKKHPFRLFGKSIFTRWSNPPKGIEINRREEEREREGGRRRERGTRTHENKAPDPRIPTDQGNLFFIPAEQISKANAFVLLLFAAPLSWTWDWVGSVGGIACIGREKTQSAESRREGEGINDVTHAEMT